MKARNPIDKLWYYFVDKCMPFGSSISCAHFQSFSDAIAHVMRTKTGKDNVNYLDDFLFIALMRWYCNRQIEIFLGICRDIKFPVALEKTCWASQMTTFLGMLLDSAKQVVSIPKAKINKALTQIQAILQKRNARQQYYRYRNFAESSTSSVMLLFQVILS